MLQIISEAVPVEIGGGTCYADIVNDGGYLSIFLDMRDFCGTVARWAKGWEVIETCLEDLHKLFDPDSPELSAGSLYSWADYCSYINSHVVK